MADEIPNGLSALARRVVDKRISGLTIEEIAEEMQITSVEVAKVWQGFIETRTMESREEQWVLMLLRLENLLTKVNSKIESGSDLKDYEVALKLLDRIEALMALNATRKTEADEALAMLTKAQSQLVLSAMLQLQADVREIIQNAVGNAKTIKAIKGELVDGFDNKFLPAAQKALEKVAEA